MNHLWLQIVGGHSSRSDVGCRCCRNGLECLLLYRLSWLSSAFLAKDTLFLSFWESEYAITLGIELLARCLSSGLMKLTVWYGNG